MLSQNDVGRIEGISFLKSYLSNYLHGSGYFDST